MLIGNIGNIPKTLWISLVFLLLPLQLAWGQTGDVHEIDGKVTFKIERKNLSMQEAQTALNNRTAISLKVSLILEGEWVTILDEGKMAFLNSSAFAYGIAQNGEGRTEATAPLYKNDPPAYMYANSVLGCTADGISLTAPSSMGMYISFPGWEEHNGICPVYSYGALFDNSSPFYAGSNSIRRTTHEGADCYELDLFNISFRLKDLQTVYVRGIDCNTAGDLTNAPYATSTDNETDLDGSTVGTTILNLTNPDGRRIYYWPGSYSTQAADWTLAPSDYYGGIIPGGLFIEQVPEWEQFEPCFGVCCAS